MTGSSVALLTGGHPAATISRFLKCEFRARDAPFFT